MGVRSQVCPILALGALSLAPLGCGKGKLGLGGPTASASAVVAAPPTPPPATSTVILPGGISAPATFANLAAKADPAVVFVKTLQEQTGRTGRRRVVGEGLGSAFVYDPSGLILTNNHVIANATDIEVTFGKTRIMKATVVGRDPPTDIAVLRVDAKGLPHLPLGDSDRSRVGDWVMAIGNPFGLSHTVSAGIVSAKGRTRSEVRGLNSSGYFNFLQTDASINPGNSGGPLIDTGGNVVGINTAIRAQANNIGFAIPINMVKELLPRLIADGKITRSAIGIVVDAVRADDVQRLKLNKPEGALVRQVVPGGPASRAGLAADDVIRALDGKPISGPERLRWLASIAGVGKKVELKVARGRRELDMKVTLGELPAPKPSLTPSPSPFGRP